VAANSRTGLAIPDVFSFGNLAGDTGDSNTTFRVNASDLGGVKQSLNAGSVITGHFDFNRDGRVNALDLGAAKGNLNRTLASIAALSPASVAALADSGAAAHLLDDADPLPPA